MTHYKSKTLILSPASTVYEALTTQRGIRNWWTETAEVGTQVGDTIVVNFGSTFKRMKIDKLRTCEEVCWSVTDARLDVPGLSRSDEWIGTRIQFLLMPLEGNSTTLQLEHFGLTPSIECFDLCSQGWAHFIQSLKDYCETGRGTPFKEAEA